MLITQNLREDKAVDALKDKVIKEFLYLLHRLNMGYLDSYEHILAEIAFIENAYYLDNVNSLFEKFMNHE